jgi:Raf kinase inhibitor-like YbhB/YbcL family protein
LRAIIISLVIFFSFYGLAQIEPKLGGGKMDIELTSTAFKEGEFIPKKYTCDGRNVSPPLEWNGVPVATKSISLICDDPDAPIGTWVHWVIFNIPAFTKKLNENIKTAKVLEDGTVQGNNDFRKIGYGGPCPPSGTHRYFFKIYALDIRIELTPGATKDELIKEMEGHILSEGKLMGKYSR